MTTDVADFLVWIIRAALFAGVVWGGWLCIGQLFLPERSEKMFEHFATFAVLVLLLTTLGGAIHAA
ncbi:MAG TPA: hypothetical protein VHI32_00905 [Burkholderiales bacterium]|jgi:hypothetical protein|nr:hypothetical protein [Burkholderiales bacterium]